MGDGLIEINVGQDEPSADLTLPYGHEEGEVKGPNPKRWGTLDDRIEQGAAFDSADAVGQPVRSLEGIPEDEHDQYIVKGPAPEAERFED